MTTLIILNEEMNDVIKIVKSLKDTGLFINQRQKWNKTLEIKQKNKKVDFLACCCYLLTSKGIMTADEGLIRADQEF